MRGPNVTQGYWGLPEATAQAIDRDGWFHTGDAGFFDDEGFLTISDRIKDMIITGGENVYPAEIESQLMRHPAIAEVGVIGEPDSQWGEQVVAVVALKARRIADARRAARVRANEPRAFQAAQAPGIRGGAAA